jgi:phosphate transport system substrate-binding protein
MKKAFSFFMVIASTALVMTGCAGGNKDNGEFNASRGISVVSRETGSGTRGAFIELFGIEEKGAAGNKEDKTTAEAAIASKTDIMLTNISTDDYAIGYVSLGSLNDSVKALKINGVEATSENIINGTYKIARPFNIATKGTVSEVAQDFINFILSAEGQNVVANGYIKVKTDAANFSGKKPSGKVVVAGSSSVSPVMEKLKEAYIKVNPNASVEIQQNDSTTGMNSAKDGTCDIGMASRDLKDSEKSELTAIEIALDGVAVIVNPDNTVDALTSAQVRSIFIGETTKWSEIE